jgi:chromosome segregation ATPase
MSQGTLLTTLNEALRQLTDRDAQVVDLRTEVERASTHLWKAEEPKARAERENKQATAKYRELLAYSNDLTKKPAAILAKIDALAAEQLKMQDKVRASDEIWARRKAELREAKTKLELAQQAHQRTQKECAEIRAKIGRLKHPSN